VSAGTDAVGLIVLGAVLVLIGVAGFTVAGAVLILVGLVLYAASGVRGRTR
jgi:hypothetical protein